MSNVSEYPCRKAKGAKASQIRTRQSRPKQEARAQSRPLNKNDNSRPLHALDISLHPMVQMNNDPASSDRKKRRRSFTLIIRAVSIARHTRLQRCGARIWSASSVTLNRMRNDDSHTVLPSPSHIHLTVATQCGNEAKVRCCYPYQPALSSSP